MSNTQEKQVLNVKFTLMYLKKDNQVLLGFKKRGLGKGYWNGLGGKVEAGEEPLECVKREVKEESGVTVNSAKHVGVMKFDVVREDKTDSSIVYIFTSSDFSGEPKPTEEMNPVQWFKFDEIPFESMWADDRDWFPYMLDDKCFSTESLFDTQNNKLSCWAKYHESIESAIDDFAGK